MRRRWNPDVDFWCAGFWMTTQYADISSYGKPDANFDTWDLCFPLIIAVRA